MTMSCWREGHFGVRPVRIANCSGYHGDPAEEMYNQASQGDVDFITGDYLAEVNIAKSAEAYRKGEHPGYEATALEGIRMSLDLIHSKGIKVALNGGALNPRGLAESILEEAVKKGYGDLRVAYVTGDEVLSDLLGGGGAALRSLRHLDSTNSNVSVTKETFEFYECTGSDVVTAHAYLGARAIVAAFQQGADIVVTGRVSDASPVIAAAWYWWSWEDTQYDEIAGGLVAGHLIECSAYVTGGNFAGFTDPRYGGAERFIRPGFPIAEVARDGSCVITKHPGTGGVVDADTVRSQLLYEIQGDVYLHSDAKALLDNVVVEVVGEDRVLVRGIRGAPPPPTTKLAVFYRGGYESQLLVNTAGYGWREKCDLFEKQMRLQMGEDALARIRFLEFQRIGVPEADPRSQNSSTMYIRVVAQARDAAALMAVPKAVGDISLRHFHGFHSSLDMRTVVPRPFLAYFPALWSQNSLREAAHIISVAPSGERSVSSYEAGHPPVYEDMGARLSYDTPPGHSQEPETRTVTETRRVRLGDVALARSGDKGSNLNVGVFVRTEKQWMWLRAFLTRERMRQLLGDDADHGYSIERVELAGIKAVHLTIYGILGRGVSSSTRLDSFGKGFADYLRDKMVEVPVDVIEDSA